MSNSYSLCNIVATHTTNVLAGGLIGNAKTDRISNCYFAGTIKGVELNKSGLIGYGGNDSMLVNCFYDGLKSGLVPKVSFETASRFTSGMTRKQTFKDWNFDNIWAIDENTSYPYLKNLSKPSDVNVPLPLSDIESGTGSINDPYMITTKEQLNSVKFDLTANYKLANDIDLSNTEWIPIGNSGIPFIGTFDGSDYKIENLTILNQRAYAGLFGSLKGATVKNLTIDEENIVGLSCVGGLAGDSDISTKISNCSITGLETTIKGGSYTGGLVGYASGSIDKCLLNANVIGNQYVGGLVGAGDVVLITESYSMGNVTATNIVGGLVGSYPATAKYSGYSTLGINIRNSYSLCNIKTTHTVTSVSGGLVGRYNGIRVENCYFAGTIQGAPLYKYGLLDESPVSLPVISSYFDTNTTGLTSTHGIGRTTSQMMQKNTFQGWDFSNIWSIDEGSSYPYFTRYGTTTAAAVSINEE